MIQTVDKPQTSTQKKQKSLSESIKSKKSLMKSDRVVMSFGSDLGLNNKTEKRFNSSLSRYVQTNNAVTAIISWISYQAECFNEKKAELQDTAYEIFGKYWQTYRSQSVGLVFNPKNNQLLFQHFQNPIDCVDEELVIRGYLGTTILAVVFSDTDAALEFIQCVYEECGCEIGHKEVCPLYGFKQLSDHLKK